MNLINQVAPTGVQLSLLLKIINILCLELYKIRHADPEMGGVVALPLDDEPDVPRSRLLDAAECHHHLSTLLLTLSTSTLC